LLLANQQPLIVRIAADLARAALKVFEEQRPGDMRPRNAIEAAIRWADNQTEENRQAAADAADAAVTAIPLLVGMPGGTWAPYAAAVPTPAYSAAWAAYAVARAAADCAAHPGYAANTAIAAAAEADRAGLSYEQQAIIISEILLRN
jgi:hypothetical protein